MEYRICLLYVPNLIILGRVCSAEVYNNRVEDNARAGIFFHRSTDGAIAYNNTCKGNLEGDFGIVESFDVKVYDNVMVVSAKAKATFSPTRETLKPLLISGFAIAW